MIPLKVPVTSRYETYFYFEPSDWEKKLKSNPIGSTISFRLEKGEVLYWDKFESKYDNKWTSDIVVELTIRYDYLKGESTTWEKMFLSDNHLVSFNVIEGK